MENNEVAPYEPAPEEQKEAIEEAELSRTVEGFFLREYNEVRRWLARFMEAGDEIRYECFPYLYPCEYAQEQPRSQAYDRIMEKVRRVAFFTVPQVKRAFADMKSLSESNIFGWKRPDNEARHFLSWYRQEYERLFERATQNSDRIIDAMNALA